MTKTRLIRLAEKYKPSPDDPRGADKKALIDYLLAAGADSSSPISIKKILKEVSFSSPYTPNRFQHQLVGPLRRERSVFVGTSNKGLFLVTNRDDADRTLAFYTWRVRAELRHARNLRGIVKRYLRGETGAASPGKKERAVIYIDESGTPDISDTVQPFFVVAAVVVESRKELSGLEQRFRNACAVLKRPVEHELRTGGLSAIKQARALRELSLINYQWAAACFDKSKLQSAGFQDPKTLYRYVFQFLVGDLLMTAWEADLVIDENSTAGFQTELANYLKRQNSTLPIQRLQKVSFASSSKERLIQLADLVAGAVRRSTQGETAPLREIDHQMISLQYWPPHVG